MILAVNQMAFVALGSNLGDSHQIVLSAMDRLQESADTPLLKSSLWESDPVDCPPGSPLFVNAVVGLVPRATETPESLLARLQRLEFEFGRKRKQILNEPRILDLDLIAFSDQTRATGELILPHPRACNRAFVLKPFAEIAPDLVLPGQTKTIEEFAMRVSADGTCRKDRAPRG